MTVASHLAELVEKHRALERSIEEEMSRPHADDIRVADMKKKKLRLKEQIEQLRTKEVSVH
ncbi:YdcH family protein [Microbaculum marinisediminis]|uniref:DUF465 domain-containing protein n=1 Tax=Microbaculum marinisediminis TaxID=2931392 RepID=A0AAW5QVI7_9HYPH|nr:DUF465 domain-containing protein [Microbaculum sp. A6E488]MCT8971703.1 DUF465 domain-containing protein [Microbaculum sp. A6E488]